MNKNERECLVVELNKVIEKINNNNSFLQSSKDEKDKNFREWTEIRIMLLSNEKVMIEQALINDFIEEL